MPVPNSIDDLEPVPADNYPAGSEPVFPNLDNYLRAHAAFVAQLRDLLGTAGTDIETIEEKIETVNAALALRVAKTSDTGIALLPEGNDAQRPATGSIPAGAFVMRGNTQDPADYKPEFWDRVAAGWKVLADRTWVGQQITAAINAVKVWINEQIGFAIVYPNGGTAAAPANAAINSRYPVANPFPGHHVMCVAEILAGGKWGAAGWLYVASGGQGMLASEFDGSIVVQTGAIGISHGGSTIGQPNPAITGSISVAPLRVKVWRVRGATS